MYFRTWQVVKIEEREEPKCCHRRASLWSVRGRRDCARAREHSSDILVLYLRTFQSKAKDFHLSSQPNLTSRQGIGYSHTQRKMKVYRNKTCLSPPSLPEYFTLKMGGGLKKTNCKPRARQTSAKSPLLLCNML